MPETTTLEKILRLKVLALVLGFLFLGLVVDVLGNLLQQRGANHLLVSAVNGASDFLFVSGGLGAAVGFFTDRDKEAASTDRNRAVIKELIPDFTDAVVQGFAVKPDDLKRVATPELLDHLATSALALRLGDEQFASELYTDLRDQAIRAPERWHNVQVKIRLSPAAARSGSTVALYDVLIEWEYTTVPTHPVQRFACVSDRTEFAEMLADRPVTMPHFLTKRDGLDARMRENYELLAFAVDGEERKIRRSDRATGQTYSADIGEDVMRAGEPVRIRQLYRTVTPQSGHRLYIEAVQPSRQFSLEVDYTDTDIAYMSVTDLVSSSHHSQVSRMPQQVDARVLGIDLPGWLLPKAGFAFVWTLASEQTATAAAAPPPAQATKT